MRASLPRLPLFDELTLLIVRPIPRRQALQLAGLAVATTFLTRFGIRPAFAQSNCSCNGLPLRRGEACCNGVVYEPVTHCCTAAGIVRKSPILDLAACPGRAPKPGHVPTAIPGGCGAGILPVPLPDGYRNVDFRPCCEEHARCYNTCYAPQTGLEFSRRKADCDTGLGLCIAALCRQTFLLEEEEALDACLTAARGYQRTMSDFGRAAYDRLQREACDCCAGDVACCPETHVMCGGVCCSLGQQCVDGRCTTPCDPPLGVCDGCCVDLENDPKNCGACGEHCPTQAPYCLAGKCTECTDETEKRCGSLCVPADYQCCSTEADSPAVGCPPEAQCCSGGSAHRNYCIALDSQCCNSNPLKPLSVCPPGYVCCENECYPPGWSCCGFQGNACPPNSTCCNGVCCSPFQCCGVGDMCWPRGSEYC